MSTSAEHRREKPAQAVARATILTATKAHSPVPVQAPISAPISGRHYDTDQPCARARALFASGPTQRKKYHRTQARPRSSVGAETHARDRACAWLRTHNVAHRPMGHLQAVIERRDRRSGFARPQLRVGLDVPSSPGAAIAPEFDVERPAASPVGLAVTSAAAVALGAPRQPPGRARSAPGLPRALALFRSRPLARKAVPVRHRVSDVSLATRVHPGAANIARLRRLALDFGEPALRARTQWERALRASAQVDHQACVTRLRSIAPAARRIQRETREIPYMQQRREARGACSVPAGWCCGARRGCGPCAGGCTVEQPSASNVPPHSKRWSATKRGRIKASFRPRLWSVDEKPQAVRPDSRTRAAREQEEWRALGGMILPASGRRGRTRAGVPHPRPASNKSISRHCRPLVNECFRRRIPGMDNLLVPSTHRCILDAHNMHIAVIALVQFVHYAAGYPALRTAT
ncbi:hypothetical protein WOLCODRAFT_156711 [Wolfiporia cocos MD-104 SS10]|uniref:Uncharacterized protein n=1 Tax=Wolfiporia cocos (strain MD-104) TaxID=742152 RepID=A0A2H3JB67_WOLCO|nr:hypothetical protein WOLCODRAFT_156711 [Wolfiporia cocos MD-104 SS10]